MKTNSFNLKSNKIKAIFFDFGDTLVSLVPSREELFIQATHSIGLELSLEAVRRAYQIIDFHNKYSSITITDHKDRKEFYKNYNKMLCESLGISSYFRKLHPHIVTQFKERKRWKLLKDVPRVLYNLCQQGISLAIVANWDRNLSSLAETLGIRKFFSSIVSSQETGVEKPNPSIFNRALDDLSLSIETDRVLYVGNEYRLDVLSARAAGLTPTLIDRNNLYPHADCLHFNSIMEWFKFLTTADNEGNDKFCLDDRKGLH